MKNLVTYSFISLIVLTSYTPRLEKGESNSSLQCDLIDKEKFCEFFEQFCRDSDFQLSRIKFPCLYISYNDDFTELDTVYLNKLDWKYLQFDIVEGVEARSQIYDNFDHILRETDERIFAWEGIGNGIEHYFYFKRINGLWYLIKELNLST